MGWNYLSIPKLQRLYPYPSGSRGDCKIRIHHTDVIMSALAFQIIGASIACSTVCSGADQRKHHSSASLGFVRRIHRWSMNHPHKGLATRKMLPFDEVIVAAIRFAFACRCLVCSIVIYWAVSLVDQTVFTYVHILENNIHHNTPAENVSIWWRHHVVQCQWCNNTERRG